MQTQSQVVDMGFERRVPHLLLQVARGGRAPMHFSEFSAEKRLEHDCFLYARDTWWAKKRSPAAAHSLQNGVCHRLVLVLYSFVELWPPNVRGDLDLRTTVL